MTFAELSNIASLLVPQKITSREFNTTLSELLNEKIKRVDRYEEKLKQKVIEIDGFDIEALDIEISLGQLIKLYSVYAGAYTTDTSLVDRLMTKMDYYATGMSNKQIFEVLQAFTKGRFQNPQLYKKLEVEFFMRMNSMRPRMLAFSFANFCEYGQISGRLYESYLNRLDGILSSVKPVDSSKEEALESEKDE